MIKLIKQAPIHLSLEELTAHVGHEVLMDVDDNILQIACDPQGILDLHLRPRLINLLYIITISKQWQFSLWCQLFGVKQDKTK
jgi:hypothetical protein